MVAEAVVAKASELQDGEMRAVTVGDAEILLVRQDGTFYALGARCTHHQAPLVAGALTGARLICPWHHSCFDIRNGAREEPPALDPLPRYPVRVEGDDVIVGSTELRPETSRRHPARPDRRTFVILGGGGAGQQAAEELRALGFAGRLIMITQEDVLPYDRPHLSKEYLRDARPEEHDRADGGGPQHRHLAGNENKDHDDGHAGNANGHVHGRDLRLRDADFYAQRGIEMWQGRRVTRLKTTVKTLGFADGAELRYDALLLATGGVPRRLEVPGADLANVFTLRSQADADRIVAAASPGARVVVVGASFIGMEAAASLRERGLAVTVVAPGSAPLERALGKRVGRLFRSIHEERGVVFRLGAKVSLIQGGNAVEAVLLEGGERLPAELVVVGIGIVAATDFIHDLPLSVDGGVPVDAALRAGEGVFAAGDIARYPEARTGASARIEHWRVAQQHGRHAARSMLGDDTPFLGVPFFWTEQFDVRLGYVGHHAGEMMVEVFWGALEDRAFLGFFGDAKGRVLAVTGMARDAELAAAEELLRLDRMPSLDRLRAREIDLVGLLRRSNLSRTVPSLRGS